MRKTRHCLAFLFSAFLFISPAFSATLPSGYTELEYLTSTEGNQYIEDRTLSLPVSGSIEIKISNISETSASRFAGWGKLNDPADIDLILGTGSNKTHQYFYGNFPFQGTDIVANLNQQADVVKLQFAPNSQLFYINGILTLQGAVAGFTSHGYPFRLFRANISGYAVSSTIHWCKVYNGDDLVRHYIPARRNSDDVLGMYDTVTNTFFTNAGTGTFTAGPVVVDSCGAYTELEYIESTGTQYIDTGFVYDNNTRVVWDIQLTAPLPLSAEQASGVGYVSTGNERLGFSFGSTSKNDFSKIYLFKAQTNVNNNTMLSTISVDNNRHTIEINSSTNKGYVDGIEYAFSSNVGQINNSAGVTLPLFAWKGSEQYSYFARARLYSCKIYDNGTLARDMVPVRNSDGVVGLCDTVNDKFYTNAGAGTFTAGPVVSSCGYTELEYLELQGEAYFNTNVYLSKDMDIEFEFMPVQLTSSGVLSMARSYPYGGFQVSYNINNVINSNTYNDVLVDYFGLPPSGSIPSTNRWIIQRVGSSDNGYILEENKKYKVTIINKVGTFYKDGVVLDTHTYPADGISPNVDPLYINARSDIGNVVYENGDLHVRFYHFLATGVADIVPVKRDCDNVLGLYNKITGEFLEKIGSGTLVAGPEIAAPATITIHWGGLEEPDASGMCVYGETFTAPSVSPTAPSGLKFLGWIPR